MAIPRHPIRTPDVGVSILVNPSPNWNASTTAWREILVKSANCVIIGIVRAAFADPDGITILRAVWNRYIAPIEVISPALANERVKP